MPNVNLEQLITAARLLRPLLDDLVFVGGAVAGLLITDEAAGDLRATIDVDVVAAISSYAEYVAFGDRLRALGFMEDTSEGAPLCRWVQQNTILDVMPLDENILGFSNRWYRAAMEAAVMRSLTDDLRIRIITAPLFIASHCCPVTVPRIPANPNTVHLMMLRLFKKSTRRIGRRPRGRRL